MKLRILATQNHAVRLHEKTVHLRGKHFLPKLAWKNSMITALLNKSELVTTVPHIGSIVT
ncbi:hypothetical protein EXD76_02185 [BEV proteobacterium]|nr:hypothetical protein [Candidatus Symbiopectobacterium sp. Chty_BC]